MSLSKDESYYKIKAYKYYTKYNQLKLTLKGGGKPVWFDELVKETNLLYKELSKYNDEPKTIILTGSAALALLLGNENMDQELVNAFVNVSDPTNIRPSDLDFIYQGNTKNDNFTMKNITVNYDIGKVSYNRKEASAISSVKFLIDGNHPSLLIKDFDLTNVNENYKETSFTLLPYVEIMGVNVLAPVKLLEYYNDEMLEKNINKIKELTNFVEKIESDPKLKNFYTIISKKYKVNEQSRHRVTEPPPRFSLF